MKPYQQYMCALLSNPAFIENAIKRHGSGSNISAPALAQAVKNLDESLALLFPDNTFDVEDFMKQDDPAKGTNE